MNETTYERVKTNLLALNMTNTLAILDNYLERALKDNLSVVEVLDYILSGEAKAKTSRAVENQMRYFLL